MADLKALKNKTIITVAPTGAWPKKKDNPNVPMTPEEIAEDVYECWKAGAAVAHLHMRDDEGNGIMDPVRLKPEMASYDCGSMNWLNSGLFINSPAFLERCGLSFQEWGVKPEIEAFDPGMIANAAYYIKKGVLKTPVHFQFCMGCANGITGTMKNLVFMKEEAEKLVGAQNFTWSCFGVGHSAMEMLYGAIALGGHIRVGMEDNVLFSKGVLADSNAQFVKRAVEAVKLFGREVATPDEARQLLNLPPYNTAE